MNFHCELQDLGTKEQRLTAPDWPDGCERASTRSLLLQEHIGAISVRTCTSSQRLGVSYFLIIICRVSSVRLKVLTTLHIVVRMAVTLRLALAI